MINRLKHIKLYLIVDKYLVEGTKAKNTKMRELGLNHKDKSKYRIIGKKWDLINNTIIVDGNWSYNSV